MWLLIVWYSLFVVCRAFAIFFVFCSCWSCVVCCWFMCCSLRVVWRLSFVFCGLCVVVCCLLLEVVSSLLVVVCCCLLIHVVCCLMFVASCVLIVVRCSSF